MRDEVRPGEALGADERAAHTVLLVDDEADLRRLASLVLGRAGFNVLTAVDGQDALNVLAGPPAVSAVVSDVIMPNLSGAELVECLRDNAAQVPIGLMSGYTADVLSAHGVASGAVPLLPKPWRPNELVAFVDALIQTRTGQSA